MTNYEIKPATVEDCVLMADHMRAEDVKEVWYQAAMKPLDALVASHRDSSHCYSAFLDGSPIPILIFGLKARGGIFDQSHSIWLLGTDRISEVPVTFFKESFAQINRICKGKRIFNHVHAEHKQSLRWLKALGFTIMKPEPYGWLNKPFCYIEKDMRNVRNS